jgi:hypothetical protein
MVAIAAPMMRGDFSIAQRPKWNFSSSMEMALSPTLQNTDEPLFRQMEM